MRGRGWLWRLRRLRGRLRDSHRHGSRVRDRDADRHGDRNAAKDGTADDQSRAQRPPRRDADSDRYEARSPRGQKDRNVYGDGSVEEDGRIHGSGAGNDLRGPGLYGSRTEDGNPPSRVHGSRSRVQGCRSHLQRLRSVHRGSSGHANGLPSRSGHDLSDGNPRFGQLSV